MGILLGLAGVLLGVGLSSLLFRGRLAIVRAERQTTVQGLQERLEEGRAALVVKEAGQQQLAREVSQLESQLVELRTIHAEKLRSEEHTSELQSLMRISYAVFCLKKKKNIPVNK